MSTTTYPDGSQLTSTALTDKQIETAFQVITAQAIGVLTDPWSFEFSAITTGQFVNPVVSTLNLYIGQLVVAAGIPTGTLISGILGLNVTLSSAATANGVNVPATVTDPDAYSKVRIGWQIEGQPGPSIDHDTVTLRCVPLDAEYGRMRDVVYSTVGNTDIATDVFTREWHVRWCFYGPNALDHARMLRSALITIQFVADYLAGFSLYVNPSIKEPQRMPDQFQGRWWNRVDLECHFNEQVVETFTIGTVGSVEVEVYTKDGKISDFTVTE